jgi:hypothetical protein
VVRNLLTSVKYYEPYGTHGLYKATMDFAVCYELESGFADVRVIEYQTQRTGVFGYEQAKGALSGISGPGLSRSTRHLYISCVIMFIAGLFHPPSVVKSSTSPSSDSCHKIFISGYRTFARYSASCSIHKYMYIGCGRVPMKPLLRVSTVDVRNWHGCPYWKNLVHCNTMSYRYKCRTDNAILGL